MLDVQGKGFLIRFNPTGGVGGEMVGGERLGGDEGAGRGEERLPCGRSCLAGNLAGSHRI